MSRRVSFLILLSAAAVAAGCGGNATLVSNTNNATAVNANSNGAGPTAVNLDPKNMPPGLSASPITQPNMPGVNSGVVQPKGGTPTPGIPSPGQLKKPIKPGATPTPGIPSPEEIRRMLGRPPLGSNASPPMKSDVPMMKSTRPKPTP